MASVNKVILVGNLGRDPETRYNPEGGAITNISIATTDTWKDKTSGEKQERTEWHRVVFFSRLAEIAGEYLKKGSQVYIEGSLRTRKWQDKEGKERSTTEIVADRMQMLGSRRGAGDEIVEARPLGWVQRHRGDQRRPGGGYTRELREGALVVVDMFDHIEGADQVENRIAVGQGRDGAARGGAAARAQFRQRRCTDIDELRILDRQARAQSRRHLQPALRRREEGLDQRPGVEAFGLDQARVGPQRVVETPVDVAQFVIGAGGRRRRHAPR